jgi:Ser-tRNA(Ala) deacylase AlaX
MASRLLASTAHSLYKRCLVNHNIVAGEGKPSPPPKGRQMKTIDPHMHTAEHILNQTVVRFLGCERCFSAHIEKKKSKCDYRVAHAPHPDQIQAIESQVNRVIHDGLDVQTVTLSRAEAVRQFHLQRLPADAGDTIRIIRIGDYDACPCIGDHVMNTHALGTFRISSWDVTGDVLRIRFKLQRPVAAPRNPLDN